MPRRASSPVTIATGVSQFVTPPGAVTDGLLPRRDADEWEISISATTPGGTLTVQGPLVVREWDGSTWGDLEEVVPVGEQLVVNNRLSFLVVPKSTSRAIALSSGTVTGGQADASVVLVERAQG